MYTQGTYVPLKDLETMITPSSLKIAGLKGITLREACREKNVINVLCQFENGGPTHADILAVVASLRTLLNNSGRTYGLFEVTDSSFDSLGSAKFLYSDPTREKSFVARMRRL